jgi:hypothetical protein
VFVERLRTGARATLLVLAAALPFELVEPVTHVGPLQLSSVELFLYLTLAMWGASLLGALALRERSLAGLFGGRSATHRAVAWCALALLLSALLAVAPRGPGFKFALRSAGGMLLFAAAADLLRARGAVARTAAALTAGALAAALLAVVEVRSSNAAALLHGFHAQTFEALGAPRGSGPFQYPNIAAMYLEAATPLAVVLCIAGLRAPTDAGLTSAGGIGRFAVTAIVTFLLLDGVLATGSRAGLLGALVAVAAVSAPDARRPGRRPAVWAAVAAALAIVAFASSSALAARLRFWHDGQWYRSAITQSGGAAARLPAVMRPLGEASEMLELANLGELRWSRGSATPVTLSYHWLDGRGAIVTFDGVRTLLPADLAPGDVVRVQATVRAPSRPGRYVLWWDLVHEHTTWFSEHGNPGLREQLVVRGGPALHGLPAAATPVAPPMKERKTLARGTLWRAAVKLFRAHPLVGIGPDNFRHRYGALLRLAPDDIDERLHANSFYFETLADLGIVGSLTFALLVVTLARGARRALAAPATRLLTLGVAAALGTYLLHGLLDYFLEFTPTYAQFWLLAGMLVALQSQAEAAA